MIDLTGQVALVTGASRGVGQAIALKLAEAGADIVLNFAKSRTAADDAAAAIADLGRRVAEVQADVTAPDDIAAMVDWIGTTFGRLDIIISGVSTGEPFMNALQSPPDEFLTATNNDARSLLLLAQAARPLLSHANPGRIVAVTRALHRSPAQIAIESVVQRLAGEFLADGVRVNSVYAAPEARHQITGTALYLASPLSWGVTGQSFVVASLNA